MFHTFSSRSKDIIVPVFNALIRPTLEYATPVWNRNSVHLASLLESVQRFVTKRITGFYDLPYYERLSKLQMWTLEKRREYFDLLEVFKILHGHTIVKCKSELSFVQSNTRGHSFRLCKPHVKLRMRSETLLFRTINSWNALPAAIVNCTTLSSFKQCLRKHLNTR
jgi:ribonucleases P/MRP protein subunit RPP40